MAPFRALVQDVKFNVDNQTVSFAAMQALEWADLVEAAPDLPAEPPPPTTGPAAAVDCGVCCFCKDMPRFGGPNRLRRACERKQALPRAAGLAIQPAGIRKKWLETPRHERWLAR